VLLWEQQKHLPLPRGAACSCSRSTRITTTMPLTHREDDHHSERAVGEVAGTTGVGAGRAAAAATAATAAVAVAPLIVGGGLAAMHEAAAAAAVVEADNPDSSSSRSRSSSNGSNSHAPPQILPIATRSPRCSTQAARPGAPHPAPAHGPRGCSAPQAPPPARPKRCTSRRSRCRTRSSCSRWPRPLPSST